MWWGYICFSFGACRELVVGALPHLLQLDTQPICGSKGEEEEDGGSSSSEDEDDQLLSDPSGPFTAGKGAQTEAEHSVPKADRSDRQLGWPCQVSCNSSLSPSLHPWQISLQICTGSWLGARSGGGGSAWRNTGPVWKSWRSCGSVGVCCCLLHR